jgi:hypothetical protein
LSSSVAFSFSCEAFSTSTCKFNLSKLVLALSNFNFVSSKDVSSSRSANELTIAVYDLTYPSHMVWTSVPKAFASASIHVRVYVELVILDLNML